MKHVDIILARNLIRELFPQTGITFPSFTEEELDFALKISQPTNHHLAQAMADKGFKPAFIADYLGIKQPTVSYYLNRPLKHEYINPCLYEIQKRHSNVLQK